MAFKEKLQEYALLAEIISAIAIVASLVFVGLQIQQGAEETALNTRAVETSAYQDLTNQIVNLSTLVTVNSDFAEIVIKARTLGSLNAAENVRYTAFVISLIRHGFQAYNLYEQNIIDSKKLIAMVT